MNTAKIERKTRETDITLELNLYGTGKCEIDCNCGFLVHMLELFACHGGFDLKLKAIGDIEVDYHHLVEDVGICLGQAVLSALGDRSGIMRYGYAVIPMDETLVESVIDISGRGEIVYNLTTPTDKVGDFDTMLIREFMSSFARNSKMAVHINLRYGTDSHHILEAAFKSFAHALKSAVAKSGELGVKSSKGLLD